MRFVNKHKLILAILVLATVVRFYHLGTTPALNADEASIGYDAYSLIRTGMDQHGNSWPIHFQSFNDYKPGGYEYMVLPFVAIFGLNEWSVRFPGATFGVLSVLMIYLLVREIRKLIGIKDERMELLAALILAISPWHIHFSRGGWEVNAATLLIMSGVYFFIKGLKERKYFVYTMLLWVLSIYTYHAARVIVPLLGLGLLILNRQILIKEKTTKFFMASVLLAGVLCIPLAHDLLGAGGARASGVSLFADRGYIDRINEERGRYGNPNSLAAKLLHNQPKELITEFGKNYFEHFWGEFLFLSGDEIQRNKVPDFGELYMWQFPVLIIALFAISKKKKGWGSILLWLAIAPIPAALTFQSPHALRAQDMVIPLSVISAYGGVVLLQFLERKLKNKKAVLIGCYTALSFLVVWDFSRYIHEYYVHMTKTYPYSSQYGVKELVGYVESVSNKYDKVLITDRYDQPYILFLFYGSQMGDSRFYPENFQGKHALTERDKFGFSTVSEFDKFEFRRVNFEEDKLGYHNSLIIGTDKEIPDESNVVKDIYGTNGYLYFQAVAN